VVRTCHFKKFLEVFRRLLHLALEVILGICEIHLTRVTSFLVVADVTGRNNDVLGAPLVPLLATLGAFPSTLNGGFGRWWLAATRGYFGVS
jgi:hypothetical protein